MLVLGSEKAYQVFVQRICMGLKTAWNVTETNKMQLGSWENKMTNVAQQLFKELLSDFIQN